MATSCYVDSLRAIIIPSSHGMLATLLFVTCCVAQQPRERIEALDAFVTNNCLDCHSGNEPEGGLDLESLELDLSDSNNLRLWVQLFDRVHTGEMPPPDYSEIAPASKNAFLEGLDECITSFQLKHQRQVGRVQSRRLTNRQVERTLHSLLRIDIPLQDYLPQDPRGSSFSTVAANQSMSHFYLQKHLAAVDTALDDAFRRALSKAPQFERSFSARKISRTNPKRRCREPELLNGKAVVWNGKVTFYGRIPATTAPQDGWYRFALSVSSLNTPKTGGVWFSVRTGLGVSSAPLLMHIASFEAFPEPRTVEFAAWLPKGHMLEIRPSDATLKVARFAGGQIGTGEGEPQKVPGIAFEHLNMERIHLHGDDDDVRYAILGNVGSHGRLDSLQQQPNSQADNLRQLLRRFALRAFRGRVPESDLQHYYAQAEEALEKTGDFIAAIRLGYRALLCSPHFLYFEESPGALDDHALASRLSYFLTNSTPDQRLLELAADGQLGNSEVLREETDRLLSGAGGRKFVEDFAAEWLELDQINFTVPDRKRFPEFDPVVQLSMLDETHTFLETLLRENSSVTELLDAKFTYLNSRLARYYEVADVHGDQLQRVQLSDSPRGGLLAQGAILKVTANGSNTSPVLRGVWVSERILGVPIRPPPDNVPAIEPDIRGAKTIREQLAKHRSQASCASCHVKIDPPGFALENFDPAGKWRNSYTNNRGKSVADIDCSYTMPDGQQFNSFDEFRKLAACDPHKLAANLAEKLIVYGTGAKISFADRKEVDAIVEQVAKEDFGIRSTIKAVVTSPIFRSK